MLVGVRPYARTLARQAGTMLSRVIVMEAHPCTATFTCLDSLLQLTSILAQRLGTSGARDAFSAGPADLYHVVLALRTKPAMEGAVPAYGVRSQEGGLGTGQSHQRSYLRRAVGHAIGRRYKSHADWCSRAKPGGYTAAQRVLRGFQAGESNAVTCASALVPR